jgi:predicted molibdopterin-dependent oxidoreductase YjgC
MTENLRIPSRPRGRPVRLRVNGAVVAAHAGESVFAALVAAGVLRLREPHAGEPGRGGLCGMGVCQECRVTVDGRPDQRACMLEVRDGMEVLTDGG